MKKKYKPVALKVHPVITNLPDRFRIIRNIIGDPLGNMPLLNPHPPPFTSSPHYNTKRKVIINKNHPGNFLWPEECDLMHDFIQKHKTTFAWNQMNAEASEVTSSLLSNSLSSLTHHGYNATFRFPLGSLKRFAK
jgi:hypothetical protein